MSNLKPSRILYLLPLLLFSCKSIPLSNKVGDVQGIVFDMDKGPVSGATITIEGSSTYAKDNKSLEDHLAVKSNSLFRQQSITDSQGRFTFNKVHLGTYKISLGKYLYEIKSWPVEIFDFTDVIYIQTANYWQLLDAASQSLGSGNFIEAESFLKRADAIQAASQTSSYLHYELDFRRGNYQSAESNINRALTIDPGSPSLWLCKALLLEKVGGRREELIEALRKYLDLKEDAIAREKLTALLKEASADKGGSK